MDIEFIKTTDLNLASTLHSLNFPIDGIHEGSHPREMVFYFKKTAQLVETYDKYWKKELLVEPVALFTIRKELLDRVKARQYEAGLQE